MKNKHILTIIIILFLYSFNFTAALLIDNFSDYDPSPHLLSAGTDLSFTRSSIGSCRLDHEIKTFFLAGPSDLLTYELDKIHSTKLKLIDLSTFYFKFKEIIIFNPNYTSNTISFYDQDDNQRTYQEIIFHQAPPSQSVELSIDLLTKSYFDTGNFYENQIYKIEFTFNLDSTPYVMYIDKIETVSEPFTILTLGAGCLRLIHKKISKVG